MRFLPAGLFYCLTAIVLIFPGKSVYAQYDTTAFFVKQYTASDGLPDSYLLNIYQDKKQYLWIGTYSGLSRFDGTSFSNFGVHNGFSDLYVNQFFEFNNRLWIGNRTSIGYFEDNTYVPSKFDDDQPLYYVFGFDEVIPGKLWVYTSKGLYEWDENKWIKKTLIRGMNDHIYVKVLKNNGITYHFLADRIILQYDDGRLKTIEPSSMKMSNTPCIEKIHDRVFVNLQTGLYELKKEKLVPLFTSQLKNKTITAYFLDSERRFWIATSGDGILVSEPGNEETLAYKIPTSVSFVSRIFEDKRQNIWVTNYFGLLKIKCSFFSHPVLPGRVAGSHRFFPFKNGTGQLQIYDNKNGLMYPVGGGLKLKEFTNKKNILSQEVLSATADVIVTDAKKNYWISTQTQHLFKISEDGRQKEIHPPRPPGSSPYLVPLAWNQLTQTMYCGGNSLFIIRDDTLHEFRSGNGDKTFGYVTRLLVTKDGKLLVNSSTSGIWVITTKGEAYALNKKMDAVPDARLMFAEDNLGKIWIAYTGKGLHKYTWSNDTSLIEETEVTTLNGLPNDVIQAIAIDNKNRLWAATLAGLVVMDTLSGTSGKRFIMYNVGKKQGLNIDIHTGLNKIIADSSGDIWLCNVEDIIHFHSKLFEVYSPPPITHIENIQLNMKETDWHAWSNNLDGYFMLPQKLSLPHDQNTLTFFFKGINYNSDETIWYSYKLTGVDTSWTPPSENNVTSFIKMTPGYFTFMVRTRNSNSPWSEPATFSFTIEKPFWNTWWFRCLGILVTSIILGLIFRVQLKRIRKRSALENQLRNLEMKALKAQMNPHFIYNALNSIQSLVIDDKKTDALDYMVKFSRLLRQVLNHSELNTVSLAKELDALKLYIQLESLRLNYSLNYSIKLDDNIIPEKEMVPPMILQPFVENALWHGLSKKEGNKVLYIYVRGEENNLRFDISDNGIGRARAAEMKKPDSYYEGPRGIDITKTRLIHYNVGTATEPIEVHDIINTDNTAGGTIVTVRIKRQ